MVNLLARDTDGNYQYLDLSQELTISLTKSIEDIEDFTQRKGAYSKTFAIPGSEFNNKFFKSVFNLNATDFDNTLDTDCIVQDGGIDVFIGTMRLNKVIRQGNLIEYEIYILEDITPLSTVLEQRGICDLDFSDIDHEIDYDNISSTWTYTGGTYNDYSGLVGKVVYPLAQTGYQEGETFATFDFSSTGFTSTGGTAVQTTQFKPWVNLRYILDKVFEDAEFTFQSDFLDSDYFRSIFMLAGSSDTMGANSLQDRPENQNFFSVNYPAPYYYPSSDLTTYKYIINNDEDYDYLDKYTLSTYPATPGQEGAKNYHTIPVNGDYQYRLDLYNFIAGAAIGPSYVDIALRDIDTGTIYNVFSGLPVPTTGIDRTLYLNYTGATAGTRVAPFIRLNSGSIPQDIGIRDTVFTLYSSPNISTTGATMDWSFNLPCEVTNLDLLKNVLNYFNCVMIPQGEKDFLIEPYVDFLDSQSGETRDWAQKLNLDESYTIEPLDFDLRRIINFNYADDTSALNDYNLTNFNKYFGEYIYTSDNTLLSESNDIDFIFQSLPTSVIDNANDCDFIVPRLFTNGEGEITQLPMSSGPRLGFYTGQKIPYSGSSQLSWYIQSGSTTVEETYYPVISNLSILSESTTDFSDLSIKNQWNYFQSFCDINAITSNDVYGNFYKNYFETIYSREARLFTGIFYLTPEEINSIAFNDKIYFLNSEWRLLEIQDGDITQPSMVKCKFLKVPYRTENPDLIAPDYAAQKAAKGTPTPTPTVTPSQTPFPPVVTVTPSSSQPATSPTPTPTPSARVFSPSDVAGLTIWYDFDDTSSMTLNGSNIEAVNDKSGNNFHLTANTGSYPQISTDSTYGGNNVATFDGVSQEMYHYLSSTYTGMTGHSFFYVFKMEEISGSGQQAPYQVLDDVGGDEDRFWGTYYESTNRFRTHTEAMEANFTPYTSYTTEYPYILLEGRVYDNGAGGSVVSVTLNDTAPSSTSTGAYDMEQFNKIGVGGRVDVINNDEMLGNWGEFIFYDRKISDADRSDVIAYLKSKWNYTGW